MARGQDNKENMCMNSKMVSDGTKEFESTVVYMGHPEWKAQGFAQVEAILSALFGKLGQNYDKFERQTEIAD